MKCLKISFLIDSSNYFFIFCIFSELIFDPNTPRKINYIIIQKMKTQIIWLLVIVLVSNKPAFITQPSQQTWKTWFNKNCPKNIPVLIWYGSGKSYVTKCIKLLINKRIGLIRLESNEQRFILNIFQSFHQKIKGNMAHFEIAQMKKLPITGSCQHKIVFQNGVIEFIQDYDNIKAIVLVESLGTKSVQLKNYLKQIEQILGYLPRQSIIVLGTNANRIQQEIVLKRQHVILKVLRQNGISENRYLRFTIPSKYSNVDQFDANQFSLLENAIEKSVPVESLSTKRQHEYDRFKHTQNDEI